MLSIIKRDIIEVVSVTFVFKLTLWSYFMLLSGTHWINIKRRLWLVIALQRFSLWWLLLSLNLGNVLLLWYLMLWLWVAYLSDVRSLHLSLLWCLNHLMGVHIILIYCDLSTWYLGCTVDNGIGRVALYQTAFNHLLSWWLRVILGSSWAIPNMRAVTMLIGLCQLQASYRCSSRSTVLYHCLSY